MPRKTGAQLRGEGFTKTQGVRGGVQVWEKPGATPAHEPTTVLRDPETSDVLPASDMPEMDPEHMALRVWMLQRQVARLTARIVALEGGSGGGGR